MTYVDGIALAVLAISALAGLVRGLVREVLGLLAWILAAWGAIKLYPLLAPTTHGWFSDPTTGDILAYAIGFIVLLILLSVLANLAARFIQFSALGGVDRTLGLLFGVARGAVVLVLAYILVGLVIPTVEWPAVVLHARGMPLVYAGAVWTADRLPKTYRPTLVPPPGAEPAATDALHATPTGPTTEPDAAPVRE